MWQRPGHRAPSTVGPQHGCCVGLVTAETVAQTGSSLLFTHEGTCRLVSHVGGIGKPWKWNLRNSPQGGSQRQSAKSATAPSKSPGWARGRRIRLARRCRSTLHHLRWCTRFYSQGSGRSHKTSGAVEGAGATLSPTCSGGGCNCWGQSSCLRKATSRPCSCIGAVKGKDSTSFMRCKVALNLLRDSVLRSQSLTILNLNRPKEQDDNAQDQPSSDSS